MPTASALMAPRMSSIAALKLIDEPWRNITHYEYNEWTWDVWDVGLEKSHSVLSCCFSQKPRRCLTLEFQYMYLDQIQCRGAARTTREAFANGPSNTRRRNIGCHVDRLGMLWDLGIELLRESCKIHQITQDPSVFLVLRRNKWDVMTALGVIVTQRLWMLQFATGHQRDPKGTFADCFKVCSTVPTWCRNHLSDVHHTGLKQRKNIKKGKKGSWGQQGPCGCIVFQSIGCCFLRHPSGHPAPRSFCRCVIRVSSG